jgi:isoquinoline 1-oxidoreductase beta subunit
MHNTTSSDNTTSTSTPLDRRQFLGAAGGMALGFTLAGGDALAARRTDAAAADATAVNSWLLIGTDDSITLTIGSSDMGQGSFQGLATVLCEDLMVSPLRVKLTQGGPTTLSPAPIGTAINTVGSGVTRGNFWRLRDAGAAAREMLVSAAMASLGDATRSNYTVADGVITHTPTGATRRYGDVAAAAALLPVPTGAALVPDADFKCIGKTFPRADIPFKVDGSAVYGLDVRLPNMVYAVIRHAPTVGSTLAATPATPSGMLAVVPTKVWAGTGRGGELVGNINALATVGPNTWDVWQASKRLTPQWTLPANAAQLNSAQFLADAQVLMGNARPYNATPADPLNALYVVESSGQTGARNGPRPVFQVNSTYTLPYVAHATLEVLNCTVDYVAGVRCDVWAPTQSARSALNIVMAITGMTAAQVTIHTTFLGGGLGRKAEVDFISQAVQVGMAVGRPVKLMWPREEDFAHDQYRPAALVNVRASLTPNGVISAWNYRNVSPSILGQRGSVLPATGDSQGYEGSNNLPYAFLARQVEWVRQDAPIPVGFWRSVGASINTFAVESAIDELAVFIGQDAYQFRRTRITDPRWLAVLDAAASNAGWNNALPAGSARGIAIGTAFNTIVAMVVEISGVTTSSIRVSKVTAAVDCYMPVNPTLIEQQIVGGVVHGMNAALWGRQTFTNGAADVKNFNRSRMMRMNEMPSVKVVIMPPPAVALRTVAIGGIGELGVPTFAPALAAAYFRLTGVRQRSLPFFPNATMSD